jgi:ubiquinone/menaquinone biosynthesis C-methylase UbiE
MDYRHQPTSRRSLHSPEDVAASTHFEWIRQPGIGVDHNVEKITRARLAYSHLPRIRFILADAIDYLTSTKQASIDICLSIFGAFSFADPLSLLAVASRAIRPGGLLAMTLRVDDHHDSVIVLRRRDTK